MAPSNDSNERALSRSLKEIEQEYGPGTIMRLGDEPVQEVEVVPTGSLALDAALGVGGVPRGRIVEIYGPEASGKTTLGLHIIAEAQKMDGTCVVIDVEHAVDPTYAAAIGIDVDELLLSQPDTGEQALDIVEQLLRSGAVDVVMVDSVSALVPEAELEGEMGDTHVGLQARLMSQALRKLAGTIRKMDTVLIFINQIRTKIGVQYGNPETTSGGRALKFYASVRLDVRRRGQVKSNSEVVGQTTRIRVTKNKVAPPFKEATFDVIYGRGISRLGELISLGIEHDLLERRGSWYSYDGDTIGQGEGAAKEWLREHENERTKIKTQLRSMLGLTDAKTENEE